MRAANDDEETFWLNSVQSVLERYPFAEPEACDIDRVLFAKLKGPEKSEDVTPPVPFPVRRPPSVVEPVPPKPTETDVVPMTLPWALAKRMDEARLEIANVVEVAEDVVAFPVTMSVPFTVELPLVRRPAVKPMVVEVLLPYPTGVNGKIDVRDELEILLLKSVQSEEER